VAQGATARAWLWGPSALTCPLVEPYADAPGGTRYVQYFDKSRMEVTDPNSNSDDLWHVTNGLLAKELITGALQLGDDLFEQHDPSTTPVAGDFTDQLGPTYATLTPLLDAAPAPLGAVITQRLARDGTLTQDAGLAARGVTVGYVDEVTQHAIAAPFWDYMNASGLVQQDGAYVLQPLFQNPFYATGRPLTEAYWATVTVAGTPQDVLLQCFERRCLTYTPANPPGWRVEAGNVGLHYYAWRYGQLGQTPAAAPAPTTGDARVTLVMADPPGDEGHEEYVQITNFAVQALDLTGWQLKDASGNTFTFPSYTLPLNATVTVHACNGADTADTLYTHKCSAIWNNSGDTASLYDASGALVSTFTY
jgi:hypothetical protein